MPFIEWEEKYETGFKEIDDQHRWLFELINKLDDAVSGRGAPEADEDLVAEVIQELLDYSVFHFDLEERLFEDLEYPAEADHKRSHQEFRMHVVALQSMQDTSRPPDVVDLLNFGRRWLIHHIMHEDMLLKPYLLKR